MKFKEGEWVKVLEREPSPADLKNGTFYAYFCGLIGTVDRVYDDEICIRVDISSLPDDIRKRHLDIQDSMKKKWINGLSGEMRNRLSAEDKQFDLSYTILVQESDLEKTKPGEPVPPSTKTVKTKKAIEPAAQSEVSESDSSSEPEAPTASGAVEPTPKPTPEKPKKKEPPIPEGLTAAELAFLEERRKNLEKQGL
jgi:hypothetical protein